MLQYESDVATVSAALKDAADTVRDAAFDAARTTAQAEWNVSLERLADRPLDDHIILAGATVEVGQERITLLAANTSTPLSHGLVPADDWQGEEFGARTRRETIQTHSRKGKPYSVTKMLNRQFPTRRKYGRVGFQAASETGTEIVRASVKAIVNTVGAVSGVEVVP